jgi:TonB-linked SusC/RagA family outer membrane protein
MKKRRLIALMLTAMRISIIQIFIAVVFTCSSFAKNAVAQEILDREISLNMSSGNIKQILSKIQAEANVNFVYSASMIKADRQTAVNVVNKRLGDVLDETLAPMNITYRVVDNNILLYNKGSEKLQITVAGKVSAAKGGALPGVSVRVKGTSIGTTTDNNGNFSISVPDNNATLVFSYIGFNSKEVPLNGQQRLNVLLEENAQALGEVVVVGYSTQRKKDLTGAVSIVNVGDMVKQPTASVNNLLQGQASGVTVLGSGQPGEQPQVRIRGVNTFGNNNPLFVVDGVPTQNISDLNPNDVESMQVLKDAGAASIYGSRASNGVIVITTRKGKGKVQVSYDAYYGTQRPKSGNVWNMLSPQDMANLKYLAKANSGDTEPDEMYGAAPYTLPDYIYPIGAKEGDPAVDPALYNLKPFFTSGDEYNNFYRITKANKAGTNWNDEIFNPAPIQSQNLAVSGGSDQGSYLFSANYFNQKGTLLESYLKRYTIRSNTSFNIGKFIKVGENLAYSITDNPQIGGLTGDNAIGHAFREQPIVPVYDIMGNFAGSYGGALGDAQNPVAMLRRTVNNKGMDYRLFGNVFAEAKLFNDFTLRTTFGGESSSGNSRSFTFPQFENAENNITNSYQESSYFGSNYTWTNTLSYDKTIGKHALKVLAGTEYFKNRYRAQSGSNRGYFSFDPNYTNLSTGSGPKDANSSPPVADALFSLIGRVDYTYNDKYLLGATIRRDGSSKFLEHVYGVFPSVSAGWRVSQEGFMKDVKWIDDLKIRGSWGTMGNQLNVDDGNAYSTFGSTIGQSYYALGGGNDLVSGFFQNKTGDPSAKWEKDINSNIGFDATLFNDKLEITADFYRKDIKDLLYNPELLATNGTASTYPFVNIAKMKNTGFDVSLTSHTDLSKDLRINATATFTSYNNTILKIASSANYYDIDARRFDGSNIIRNAVGHSVSQFFGYKVDGFWNSDAEIEAANLAAQTASNDPAGVYQTDMGVGRFKYADVNGDGLVNADDRTFLGNANPDFSYGLNIGATYKSFDFSAFFYGVQGNNIWNQVKWWTDFYSDFGGAKSQTALYDSWTPTHMNAKAPIQETTQSFSTNSVPNSYFVENGSYLRLKNVQIGYTLPSTALQKIGVSRLRVYISGANLFTVTKYSGVDPEIGTSSANDGVAGAQTAYGVDEGAYPNQRTFLFGVNLHF